MWSHRINIPAGGQRRHRAVPGSGCHLCNALLQQSPGDKYAGDCCVIPVFYSFHVIISSYRPFWYIMLIDTREARFYMKIVICEDDQAYLQLLAGNVNRWAEQNHISFAQIVPFNSSEELLEALDKGFEAEVYFMDILFTNEMNGMAVANTIRMKDDRAMIVFITSSEAYAKQGYVVNAFRYLNKPVCYEDLATCLDVAFRQYTLAQNKFFILPDGISRMAFFHEDILYLEARSPYTEIHLIRSQEEETVKIRKKITTLIQKLPQELFVQCHRSYCVNILHVRSIRRAELSLSTGETLPVSRTAYGSVCKVFDQYYQGRKL
jgi:DNA-binding LytR/AlgR family response regulator